MAIKIINKKLHRDTMRKVNLYYNNAGKAYNKGDMKMGKKWEAKGDLLYERNYTKMFNVKKTKRGYVLIK